MKIKNFTQQSFFQHRLPLEIQAYILGLLDRISLNKLCTLNKYFNQITSHELIRLENQYNKNIFYAIGKPLKITPPATWLHDSNFSANQKNKIGMQEIYNSFHGSPNWQIKLFKTEEEAFDFSRSLKTYDEFCSTLGSMDFYQPAIFKVLYLGEKEQLEFKDEIVNINPNAYFSCYDTEPSALIKLSYCEVNRINLLPKEGILKIAHRGKNDLLIKKFNYEDYAQLTNNNPKNSCTIS